jgi:hypothetical protein
LDTTKELCGITVGRTKSKNEELQVDKKEDKRETEAIRSITSILSISYSFKYSP